MGQGIRQTPDMEIVGVFGDSKYHDVRGEVPRQTFVSMASSTLDDQLNMRLANERLLSFLSAGMAILASLLAVVGLHGVLAFVVARRTREIGIRIALGAERGSVVRLVMREMALLIVLGIAGGAAAASLCGGFVESQLFGVKAADPAVYAMSAAGLLAASLAAAFLPAWRASRIDPMQALRYE